MPVSGRSGDTPPTLSRLGLIGVISARRLDQSTLPVTLPVTGAFGAPRGKPQFLLNQRVRCLVVRVGESRSDCGSESRGFESHKPPHINNLISIIYESVPEWLTRLGRVPPRLKIIGSLLALDRAANLPPFAPNMPGRVAECFCI